MWSTMKGGKGWGMKERGRTQLFGGGGDIKQKDEVAKVPIVANTDPLIKNTLEGMLGLIIVIIFKIVREIIYFQTNKFVTCKVRDGKEMAKCLMVFNLHKIIHPFQSEKYLRN